MADWAWAYFTHQRFARLILEVERGSDGRPSG
jgi:hypothetical protein